MTPDQVADEALAVLQPLADADDAVAMQAYMKGRFPFLGVKAGPRRAAVRPVFAALRRWPAEDVLGVAEACWRREPRELQHVGADLLRRHGKQLTPSHLPRVRALVQSKSWWDTVDTLAAHVVGAMVQRHPELVGAMDAWSVDDDPWVARTAILHQLTYKADADQERLFRYVHHHRAAKDFFLRKASGWALRQHARVAPDAVRAFVEAHADELSGLTKREATKHL